MVSVILICGCSNLFSIVEDTSKTPQLIKKIKELRQFLGNNRTITDSELLRYLLHIDYDVLAFANDKIFEKWASRVTEAIARVPDEALREKYGDWYEIMVDKVEELQDHYLSEDALDDNNATTDDLKHKISDLLLARNEQAFEKWYLRIAQAIHRARINGNEEAYKNLLNHKNERVANVHMLRDLFSPVSKR